MPELINRVVIPITIQEEDGGKLYPSPFVSDAYFYDIVKLYKGNTLFYAFEHECLIQIARRKTVVETPVVHQEGEFVVVNEIIGLQPYSLTITALVKNKQRSRPSKEIKDLIAALSYLGSLQVSSKILNDEHGITDILILDWDEPVNLDAIDSQTFTIRAKSDVPGTLVL